MRFSELAIQTHRAAPSEIRTEGLAFLYRAGYVSRAGELETLGQLAVEQLKLSAAQATVPDFIAQLGLVTVQAQESGEYFALQKTGEQLLTCPACGYAARRELARSHRPPFSSEEPLPLEKVLTPECGSIAQLAQFLHIPQQKTAKALMFTRARDGKFVFVVLRGDLQLSEPKLKAAVGEVRLATPEEIAAAGAVAGYASPLGLKDALVAVDELVTRSPNLVAGANEHGFHLLNTNTPRDYAADLLVDLSLAAPGEACPQCGAPLESRLAAVIYEGGQLLYEKLLLALAEDQHDEKGLTLPRLAAPFEVYLMNVPGKTLDTLAASESLYAQFTAGGLRVLFDDRNERAGVKFNDADLIGCPLRVTVGERGLQNGMLELKGRGEAENRQVPLADALQEIQPE
jgi:prolyl-tRNA synthetase